MMGLDWIQDDLRKKDSNTNHPALLRGGSPLSSPVVSVQYLRYIPQGHRRGACARMWAKDPIEGDPLATLRACMIWSEVNTVVEVLTQGSRCEGAGPSHYANTASVPVRPHN